MGHERVEARIAVQRIEVEVLFDAEAYPRGQPEIDRLPQKRERRITVAPMGRHTTEVVCGDRRARLVRARATTLYRQVLAQQLLCLGEATS